MKYLLIGAFVIMVCAQWIVPMSMIRDANNTLDQGVEYKFKTAPVDPSDPFRGKYITLNFDLENYHPLDTNETHFPDHSSVYALLDRDSAGYAKIRQLVDTQPTEMEGDYMTVTYNYGYGASDPVVSLNFPFTTFYVEESKASDAEQLYWQNRRDSAVVCYAKVRVFKGDTKLVDVMLNDSSIVDVVARMNRNKKED